MIEKIISHRGNLFGEAPLGENSPECIMQAAARGYDVEIDVWYDKVDGWGLGHDEPVYPIPLKFLLLEGLWIHTKNFEAFKELHARQHHERVNFFWHESDKFTITGSGYIWTCDYSIEGVNVVHMIPWGTEYDIRKRRILHAICVDNPIEISRKLQS